MLKGGVQAAQEKRPVRQVGQGIMIRIVKELLVGSGEVCRALLHPLFERVPCFGEHLFGLYACGDVGLHTHEMRESAVGIVYWRDAQFVPEGGAVLAVIEERHGAFRALTQCRSHGIHG